MRLRNSRAASKQRAAMSASRVKCRCKILQAPSRPSSSGAVLSMSKANLSSHAGSSPPVRYTRALTGPVSDPPLSFAILRAAPSAFGVDDKLRNALSCQGFLPGYFFILRLVLANHWPIVTSNFRHNQAFEATDYRASRTVPDKQTHTSLHSHPADCPSPSAPYLRRCEDQPRQRNA